MAELERQIRAWADAAAPDDTDAVEATEVIGRIPTPTTATSAGAENGRRGPSRRPLLVALVAAAVLAVVGVVVVVNRDDGSAPVLTTDGSSAHRVAVDPDMVQGPGSPIAEDVVVQPGSSLVGRPVPVVDTYLGEAGEQDPAGWAALVLVDGDPVDVWTAYADVLGLADQAPPAEACTVTTVDLPAVVEPEGLGEEAPRDAPPPVRFLTEPPVPGENHLACRASIGGIGMVLIAGAVRCTQYQPEWVERCTERAAAHLVITVDRRPLDPELEELLGEERNQLGTFDERYARAERRAVEAGSYDVVEPDPIPPGQVRGLAIDPELPSGRLPGPGESLADDLDYFINSTEAGRVPPGGRSLVAPTVTTEGCGGSLALLAVPGTPEEATSWFDEASDDDDPLPVITGTFEGQAFAAGTISTAGGYYLSLTALDLGDGTSQVLISQCGD